MASFTAGTTFVDGVANDVTAAKLGALITNATPTSGLIQDRTSETVIATNDTFLFGDASDSNNLKRMTVDNLFKASINSTTGTVVALTTGTTTSTAQIVTTGTTTNFNSTTGTITTLNSTTPTFLGAITGSTNTINIGSGQIYKDAGGKVLINSTTEKSSSLSLCKLQVYESSLGLASNTDYAPQINLVSASATSGAASYILLLRQKGTIESPTTVGSGNQLGNIFFGGYDGTVNRTFSGITSNVDGAVSTGTVPSNLIFSCGSTSAPERMRIDSSGNVSIGTTSATSKFHVNGEITAKNVTINVNTLATATGTQNLDFTSEGYLTHSITGNITYTASNYAIGRSLSIRIASDATQRSFTFPTGWVFVGAKPTAIAASKVAVLSITSFGTTEANCVASYAVQT
jgi:hypothetical protein